MLPLICLTSWWEELRGSKTKKKASYRKNQKLEATFKLLKLLLKVKKVPLNLVDHLKTLRTSLMRLKLREWSRISALLLNVSNFATRGFSSNRLLRLYQTTSFKEKYSENLQVLWLMYTSWNHGQISLLSYPINICFSAMEWFELIIGITIYVIWWKIIN